jgi:hypothetical protein
MDISELERGCVEPGHWMVEGVEVRRWNKRTWLIHWDRGDVQAVKTLEDALVEIAMAIEDRRV